MYKVRTAKSAGFCFGVKKAVDAVYREAEKAGEKVYTYGPIIHNDTVIRDLEDRGVEVIESTGDLKNSGTLVIRSHGVSRQIQETCLKSGMHIVDATCPYVKKIHRIVQKRCDVGDRVIIIGNEKHPEVAGIRGWGDSKTTAIESMEEFLELGIPKEEPLSIVAQTTFNHNKFKEIVDKIRDLGYDINCFNTICNATQERQTEAAEIASEVDVMIVIGDKNSSNTNKLVEICKKECADTVFIQTLEDLNPQDLVSVRSVGITAGASTPKHIIEEVQSNVRP